MTAVERINIILGVVAALFFLIVIAKFITKRFKKKRDFFKRADIALLKIHKSAAIILLVSGSLHGILSIINFKEYFNEYGIIPNSLGIIGFLSCIVSTIIFYMKKKLETPKTWILHHRFHAVVALFALIGHIVLSI